MLCICYNRFLNIKTRLCMNTSIAPKRKKNTLLKMASFKMNLLFLSLAVICVYLVHEISAQSPHCGYHRHTVYNFRICNSTHCKYYYRVRLGLCSDGNLIYDFTVSVNGSPLYYTIIRSSSSGKRSMEAGSESIEAEERSIEAEERHTKSVKESDYAQILRDLEGGKVSKRNAYLTTEIEG